MFQTNVVEKLKTHFIFNNFFFFFENRAVYGIMWKDIVEPARPQMTIWGMSIACWIPKATNAYSEYIIIIAFSTATMVTRKLLSEQCTYIVCLVMQFY